MSFERSDAPVHDGGKLHSLLSIFGMFSVTFFKIKLASDVYCS